MKMQKRKKPIWPWIVGILAAVAISNAVRTGGDGTVDQPPETMIDPVGTFSERFTDTAKRYFSSSVTASVSAPTDGKGVVAFKSDAEYFGTGDKINKVMAIESARLFREVKDLNDLSMTLPNNGKTYQLQVTRDQMDDHYGMKLADLSMDTWRSDFLQKYDTKEARVAFVTKYVKVQ